MEFCLKGKRLIRCYGWEIIERQKKKDRLIEIQRDKATETRRDTDIERDHTCPLICLPLTVVDPVRDNSLNQ